MESFWIVFPEYILCHSFMPSLDLNLLIFHQISGSYFYKKKSVRKVEGNTLKYNGVYKEYRHSSATGEQQKLLETIPMQKFS